MSFMIFIFAIGLKIFTFATDFCQDIGLNILCKRIKRINQITNQIITQGALDFTNCGSALSVRSFVKFGSSVSVRAFARIGGVASLMDGVTMASSMSVRNFVRVGGSASKLKGY
jgi:hypothetical protein